MKCPYCGDLENKVVDSRLSRDSLSIRRRRECLACERRFTTYEKVEVRVPLLIKRDGRREAYNREKLTKGITIACQKRPVSPAEIEAFIDQLERQLQDSGFNEVHTTDLGERVAGFLKQLDPVAYVRFASVYRQFATLEDFNSEIKKLDYSDRPHNQMEPLAKAEQVKQ